MKTHTRSGRVGRTGWLLWFGKSNIFFSVCEVGYSMCLFLALLMFLFCVIPLLGIPSPCLSFLLLSRNPEGARVAQTRNFVWCVKRTFSVGSRRRAAQNKAHVCGPQAQLKNVTLRADCWKFWVFCSSCGGWCSKDTSEIDAENDAMEKKMPRFTISLVLSQIIFSTSF